MIVLLTLGGMAGACLAAGWFDKQLAHRFPAYQRTFDFLFGEPIVDPRRHLHAVPEPRSHVRTHCPFCGYAAPLHDTGCGRLDRMDSPRRHDQETTA